MERFIDVIAPASFWGFWVKSLVLVSAYTAFDFMIRGTLTSQFDMTSNANHLVTFLIGAPFALFVMWIMSLQRDLKERLTVMSRTDSLTGLSNRTCFLSRAAKQIETGKQAGLLMIDLDHFKKINDTYGHYCGDLALRHVAEHLRQATRDTDIVGRLGGEEFAVLLPETSAHEARQIADRICTPIHMSSTEKNRADTIRIEVTMSVGGVMTLPDEQLVSLLSHADEAMYQAKNTGRARVVFHELDQYPAVASVQ